MPGRREWFSEFRAITSGNTVSLGNEGGCEVKGEGTIIVSRLANGEWRESRKENVLYVPNLKKNLFSVGVCAARDTVLILKTVL